MNRSLILLICTALISGGVALTQLAEGEPSQREQESQRCSALSRSMLRYHAEHITKRPADQNFARRVSDLMLRRLDGQKTLLLASEAEELRAEVERFTLNTDRSCDLFNRLLKRQRGWASEMSSFVDQMMNDPKLKIDRTLEINTDPDERSRPKTDQERAALRRALIHWQLATYVSSGENLKEAKKKLSKRYALIQRRVNEQTFTDEYTRFLDSYASAFDPHTSYFSVDMLEDFRISMKLSLEGIGATLQQRDGYTRVMDIVPGGAADRQGQLKRKDKIIGVGQGKRGEVLDVVDMALRDVVRKIRGKKGTKVRLRVMREKRSRPLEIVIERDKIDLKEQAATLKWETIKRDGRSLKLAILSLPSFYGGQGTKRQSHRDVERLLNEAKEGGAEGLVFDLSMNSGGLLTHAVEITGFFLRLGAVVGVRGEESKDLRDSDPRVQWSGPLVILTSRISASASEIVSGALSDYRRAVLVGDHRTFGKGTVQNIQMLGVTEGAMKVTIARFHRPNGQSTQNVGVKTDIVLPSLTDRSLFAESEQRYALPTAKVAALSHDGVNGTGEDHWTPIAQATIDQLATRSRERVKESEEFQEIQTKLLKLKESANVIRIAEILDEPSKEEEEEDELFKKRDKLTPQAKEALEVLADLVTHK